MNTKYTTRDYSRMIRLYQKGETSSEIAKRYGVGTGTICRILKRHGLTLRPQARRLFEETMEQVIVKQYLTGASHNAIAAEFGCSRVTVRNVLLRHGQESRRRGKTLRVFTAEQEQEIVRLFDEGLTQSNIGERFGCAQTTVSKILRRHRINTKRVAGKHSGWKGGRSLRSDGYVQVLIPPDSPLAPMSKNSGYVLEHRLVLAQHLGRPLLPSETVHHIDGDRANNRIENLQLRQGKHGKGVSFVCRDCGSRNVEAMQFTET